MKLICITATLTACLVSVIPSFGQMVTVYDNGVSVVNDGRVNDTNYPVFLTYADNFSLASGGQINQVKWLGAYKNGDLLPDADDGFTIRFFAFSGGTPATAAFATY